MFTTLHNKEQILESLEISQSTLNEVKKTRDPKVNTKPKTWENFLRTVISNSNEHFVDGKRDLSLRNRGMIQD